MLANDFYSLLQQVTVDSKDDGHQFQVTDRITAIQSLLQPSGYQLLKSGKLFLLYGMEPLEQKEIVLISSHIDCVYNRCYCKENETCYQGTFDNSLTNAAVLYNMLHHRFPKNVVVAFTGDEERDSGGALEVIGYLLNQSGCRVKFALVTDVTNEGWEAEVPFSIENDLGIDLWTAHGLVETLSPYPYSFVHHAEPDESWDYDSVRIPSLTLCTPVAGDMHSDEGVITRKDAMPVYCEALERLAHFLSAVE